MTIPDITPVDGDTAFRGPIEIRINVGTRYESAYTVKAVAFGEWAAVPQDGGAWTVRNTAIHAGTNWQMPQAVAIEAARLLASAVPHVEFGGTAEERKAWGEFFKPIATKVREQAGRVRPKVAARPYLVTISRSAVLLVVAESDGAAVAAVHNMDSEDLDNRLAQESVSVEAEFQTWAENGAARIGMDYRPDGSHMDDDGLFFAYKGRTYRPDACPAHLYMEPEPRDHAGACPAGPRTSSFGRAEPGPCNCNVRCFPAAP